MNMSGLRRIRWPSAPAVFHSPSYERHNRRRQEHLATLGLPLVERAVLETGAGIGDHTTFFLDRGCTVTVTDGRRGNVRHMRQLLPTADAKFLDLDNPDPDIPAAEVVYCYGTLYHLMRPAEALEYLAERCTDLLLLETCVSVGDEVAVNLVGESIRVPSQATSGKGCRPTRPWLWRELGKHFSHVYATTTQPWHEEFPLDWSAEPPVDALTRAVFVASRRSIDNPLLTGELPVRQTRH